jgi:hypothetical protein
MYGLAWPLHSKQILTTTMIMVAMTLMLLLSLSSPVNSLQAIAVALLYCSLGK